MKKIAKEVGVFVLILAAMLFSTAKAEAKQNHQVSKLFSQLANGKTADGKYTIYKIHTDSLDDFQWAVTVNGQSWMISDQDILKALPAVDKADVNKSVVCGQVVCFTRNGYVVGVSPNWK